MIASPWRANGPDSSTFGTSPDLISENFEPSFEASYWAGLWRLVQSHQAAGRQVPQIDAIEAAI